MIRPKFSLGLLLLICPIVALLFLWGRKQHDLADSQRTTTTWINDLQQGVIGYDSQPENEGFVDPRKDDPGLIARIIGPEYVRSIDRAILTDPLLTSLQPISTQHELRRLEISSRSKLDLRGLIGLSKLEFLTLNAKVIDDLGPLHGLASLRNVIIADTQVPDDELDALRAA